MRVMHSDSDNLEIMIYNKAEKVIQELFDSRLSRYQTGLEEFMKGSDFISDCVNMLPCKCHKTNLQLSEWYIDSPVLLKNEKRTVNAANDDGNFLIILQQLHQKLSLWQMNITGKG